MTKKNLYYYSTPSVTQIFVLLQYPSLANTVFWPMRLCNKVKKRDRLIWKFANFHLDFYFFSQIMHARVAALSEQIFWFSSFPSLLSGMATKVLKYLG